MNMERNSKVDVIKHKIRFQVGTHLKSAHISRVSRVFQAVLIALQEEFEEKSEMVKEKEFRKLFD